MDLQISINLPKQQNHLVLIDPDQIEDFNQQLPNNIQDEISHLPKNYLPKGSGNFIPVINKEIVNSKQKVTLFSYKSKKLRSDKTRLLGYKIGKFLIANDLKTEKFNLVLSLNFDYNKIQNLIYGINSAAYKFDTFKSNKKTSVSKIQINISTLLDKKILTNHLKETLQICQSTNLVRNLVNTPSMQMTPTDLASQAKLISKKNSKIKLTILNEKDLLKNKLNLIYSVGMGSGQESKLIILEYKNTDKKIAPTLLVGKGVTFDAGGLNLKPSNAIEGMKTDMAGAATVLGLFDLLSTLDLKINLIGVIPTVENLLGHNAYKPGDILTAYNGKTVEITNTDAEGRLILADAISYGIKKYNPKEIIDIATLTGACIAALGHTRTGLITNNKPLFKKLLKASQKSNDLIWPLPLDKYHRDKVKSEIADYKNWSAGVSAGASMGGAFIEKFVQKKPWAHLDIAGSSYFESTINYLDKGATGQPLNLIYQYFKAGA